MSIELRFQLQRDDFRLDVDLQLPAKGITAIFGPSGCGKTTLLRNVAGLEYCPDGYLKVGAAIWQDGRQFLPPHKRPLGYVFQEPSLFPHLSVGANLEYGIKRLRGQTRNRSLPRAIELLGIGHLLQRRPHQLSGGEQQRVAIARAVAVRPSLLLLDEPLAALDEARKREILPYLESLHRELQIPLLYVSHSRDEVARLADHLALLEAGRVLDSGPVDTLFSRLDLAFSHGADSQSVIQARIAGHDDKFDLSYLDFAGGRFAVARHDLPPGSAVRLQVLARDVSLTLERQAGTSILNIFPAVVEQMMDEPPGQTLVRLDLAGTPLLARITRKSADMLQLAPGKPVFAQIKAVALV